MPGQIGTGTANLSVNVPIAELLAIGKAAFQRGFRSKAEFARRMFLKGLELECPELAAQIKVIRLQYYGTLALLVFFCGIVVASWADGSNLRRTASRRTVTRCAFRGMRFNEVNA